MIGPLRYEYGTGAGTSVPLVLDDGGCLRSHRKPQSLLSDGTPHRAMPTEMTRYCDKSPDVSLHTCQSRHRSGRIVRAVPAGPTSGSLARGSGLGHGNELVDQRRRV